MKLNMIKRIVQMSEAVVRDPNNNSILTGVFFLPCRYSSVDVTHSAISVIRLFYLGLAVNISAIFLSSLV